VTYQNLSDSKHWRGRAEKMRALAGKMGDCNAATLLDDLAADYDRLAARAEDRAKMSVPAPSSIRG
jgi:hypothetical protein